MSTSRGRRILRKYAQSKGYDAKEFVRIEEHFYSQDILVFKDSNKNQGKCDINYKNLFYYIVKEGVKIFEND